MHDPTAEGNAFFKCDFCHGPWAEDRPMVEGHRGSLICSRCLTIAYETVATGNGGETLPEATLCTLCLAPMGGPAWRSPAYPDAWICKRCIKQSAGVLTKDKESGWSKPAS